MTKSEKRVCDAIVELYNIDGYPPTTNEITRAALYSRSSTVARILDGLKTQGRVKQYGDNWLTTP